MKLKEKIARKLRVFIGKLLGYDILVKQLRDEIEENKKVLSAHRKELERFTSIIKNFEAELGQVRSLTDMGVDVHMKSDSWAVVCLRGRNQNFVKFFRIPKEQSAEELCRQLERFHPNNKERLVIDSPRGMEEFFRQRLGTL